MLLVSMDNFHGYALYNVATDFLNLQYIYKLWGLSF